jgi:hypothetical protein
VKVKPLLLKIQRVAHPGPSQSGRVVATFRLRSCWGESSVREWSRETGDKSLTFKTRNEVVAYVSSRLRSFDLVDTASAFYARQLGRAGWNGR